MPFLPKTSRERWILALLLAALAWIGLEIRLGAKYSTQRESNMNCFRWDSRTLWTFRPSFQGTAWNQTIHTNSQGFRGGEEYALKSTHALRILALGDSRTYGFHVKDNETFSFVLQAELRRRGVDAEVMNVGVFGFTAMQCLANLERLLPYKPDIVLFAPGYNDRRYLVTRGEDSDASFRSIARLRRIAGVLEWSNAFFALMQEIGERKLKPLREHPPGLDRVAARVSEKRFGEELRKAGELCRDNHIRIVYMKIYGNPSAYGLAEQAAALYDAQNYAEAARMLEEKRRKLAQQAHPLAMYYLGLSYQALGEKEKAAQAFASHKPSGSIMGEAVLRSERRYFAIMDEAARQFSATVVDGRAAAGVIASTSEDQAFASLFYDECHYLAEGHRIMGLALADEMSKDIKKQ
ncbi:MAG: GDSL-type esterase/lipase family protein [Candidatus Omnitrophota bacterium]